MGSNEKQNQIVIQNGDKLRKWIGTLFPIILFLGGALVVLANVGTDIQKIDTKIDTKIASVNATLTQHRAASCERARIITEKVTEIKREGTPHSRANRERIIGNEKDLKHIKESVDRIEKIVEKLANRPN